jgi:hypothetical protein
VLDPDQDLDEAVVQLQRIGFDHVRGVLRGVQSWHAAGYATESYAQVSADAFAAAILDSTARQVLDVRSPLSGRKVPCRERSCDTCRIAASLLEGLGYQPVVLEDGVGDLLGRIPA